MRPVAPAFAILILLAACRSGVTDPPLEPIPNDLRSTVPADSAQNVAGDGPLAISVVFHQPVALDAISLQLVPPAPSRGMTVLSPTGRVATIHDVELSYDQPAYVLVVDGARMVAPRVVHFFPGASTAVTGRLGGCLTGRPPGREASEALVFAIDAGSVAHDGDSMLATSRADRVGVSIADFQIPGCGAFYWIRFLDPTRQYLVFAILDTNDDATYDIQTDWWAVHHTRGESAALPVWPGVIAPPISVDLELRPPLDG